MATEKQIAAARRNIKKAQAAWRNMTPRQRALRQPQGKNRAQSGTSGQGKFYRVILRPKSNFTSFRVQDVGRPGGIERVAGHRRSGSWGTHAWLISKKMAHVDNDILIGDSSAAKDLLESLSSQPVRVKGDVFKAKDRRNVPEREKLSVSRRRALKA